MSQHPNVISIASAVFCTVLLCDTQTTLRVTIGRIYAMRAMRPEMMEMLCRDNITRDYLLRVGQVHELKLDIFVTNEHDEAHEATVSVEMPPAFEYLGTDERVYSLFTLPLASLL